jgi:hypothetical protein
MIHIEGDQCKRGQSYSKTRNVDYGESLATHKRSHGGDEVIPKHGGVLLKDACVRFLMMPGRKKRIAFHEN